MAMAAPHRLARISPDLAPPTQISPDLAPPARISSPSSSTVGSVDLAAAAMIAIEEDNRRMMEH
ncbi:hypothetical protein ACLOJK_005151 [Asimina triloba]